jgi:hypothetical protein
MFPYASHPDHSDFHEHALTRHHLSRLGRETTPAMKRFSIGFKTMLGGSILRENAVEKDGKPG